MIRPQSARTNAPGAVRCYVMVADAKSGASSLQDGSHGADVEGSLCDHPPQHHRARSIAASINHCTLVNALQRIFYGSKAVLKDKSVRHRSARCSSSCTHLG